MSLLSNGFAYPFSLEGGRLHTSQGVEYTRDSIRSFLDIYFFELLFRPNGSRIHDLIFEPLDLVLYDTLQLFISDALRSFSSIDFISAEVLPFTADEEKNTVSVNISYSVPGSSLKDSFAYNFDRSIFVENNSMASDRVDLRNLEFDTLRQALRDAIPEKTPYWKDYSSSDPGIVLLDLMAGVGDLFSFYLEQRGNEMILSRARQKDSIISHGKLFDYRLNRPTAPSLNLEFRNKIPLDVPVTIPRGLTFTTERGVSYVLKTPISYASGDNSKTLTLYGGVYHEQVFVIPSNSNKEELRFALNNPNVSENFLQVYIDNVEWEEDKFIPSVSSNTNKFYVDTDSDGYSTLVFSQLRFGLPSSGSTLRVSYISTGGSLEEIGEDTLVSFSSSVEGTNWSEHATKFMVYSSEASSGGDFQEDYLKIKEKIPLYLSTLWRAVTLRDYSDLCLLYPGVRSAIAHRSPTARHTAQVFVRTVDDTPPSALFLSDLRNFLLRFSMIGAEVQTVAAEEKSLDIRIEGTTTSAFSNSLIKSNIDTTITTYVNSLDLGETLYLDDIYQELLKIEGLQSSRISNLSFLGEIGVDHKTPPDDQFLSVGSLIVNVIGGV